MRLKAGIVILYDEAFFLIEFQNILEFVNYNCKSEELINLCCDDALNKKIY